MSEKRMNQREELLELFRIYGKLKCFEEFQEFKNFKQLTFEEKSKLLTIGDIIDLSTKECLSTDIPGPLLYKQSYPEWLSNMTYFLIVRKFIQEKREEKNPFYKLINDSYDKDNEIVKEDTYKKQAKRFIEDIFIIQNPNMMIYEDGKETTGKKNIRYAISNWYANELDLYLKKRKVKTFSAFIEGRYTDITFEKYNELVNEIKEDIAKMKNGYQNIRLYNVERFLNFELIKYICKIIHNKDQLLKYSSNLFSEDDNKDIRNIKKEIVKGLLRIKSIADPEARYLVIEAIRTFKTQEETLNIKKNILDNYCNFYNISMIYGLYILENAYSEEEIFELIELDKEFIEKLYTNKPKFYYNDYEFNKDFIEDDFRIVMEVFQESYGRILNRNQYKEKIYYRIAEGFNANLTNSEISENCGTHKNVTEIGIKLYLDWFEEIDLESVFDIVMKNFKGELKNDSEKDKISNTIVQAINTKLSLYEIGKENNITEGIVKIFKFIYIKHKKMLNPKIIVHIILRGYKNYLHEKSYKDSISKRAEKYLSEGMSREEIIDNLIIKNENNTGDMDIEKYEDVTEGFSDSIWEIYAISDYLSKVPRETTMKRLEINEFQFDKVIDKTVRGYAVIDDKRKHPYKSNNQLSKTHNLSSHTIERYIKSNKPHKSTHK